MVRSAAVVIGMVLLLVIAGLLIASAHWKQKTRKLSERLETLRSSPETEISRPEMLKGLPAPVQRYFRRALEPGTPMVAKVRVRHRGSFNMAEDDSNWKPFTSRQLVNVNPPGFLWDAKISVLPGLSPLAARVHDGYIGGEGILHASLGGLIPLVKLRDSGALARGELMRYLAEAAWYPTALLPGENLRWEGVDRHSARAVLQDGENEVSLLFRFNDEGLIASVYSDGRDRMAGRKMESTPWEGRWKNYRRYGGMLVPGSGEVLWHLPEGENAYWRGEITDIRYEFSAAAVNP